MRVVGLTWCILLVWVENVVGLQQLQAAVAAGLLLCCCTDGCWKLGCVCHDSAVYIHKAAVLLQHDKPAALVASVSACTQLWVPSSNVMRPAYTQQLWACGNKVSIFTVGPC